MFNINSGDTTCTAPFQGELSSASAAAGISGNLYSSRRSRGAENEVDRLTQIKARSLAQILLENIQLQQELRRLQTSGVHAGGLTSMEDQVASLAHEIKQPISAATVEAGSCLSFLQPDRMDLQQAREAATMMIVATKRAADIVDRMRSLYRRGTFKRRPVNVNDMICAIGPLLSDLAATHSVSVHTELDPALPMCCADFVQLQQVLINLMTNGIEAMHDKGGRLTVTSKTAHDGHLLIAVSDQGIGLPPDGTDQIFEAFFTTKPEGTGLGLSISRAIVELHGGRLWAGANAARGAVFQFTLPVDNSEPQTSRKSSSLHG